MSDSTFTDALRLVLRRVASPVVVVTSSAEGVSRGVTIGSFTSVSLSPALVSFNLQKGSQMEAVLTQSNTFAVHVLNDLQAKVATRFATPGLTPEAQFEGFDVSSGPEGLPVLAGCISVLFCTVEHLVDTEDHWVIIGRVQSVQGPNEGSPILYMNRQFYGMGVPV